jgi:hypothetical protein
MNTNKHERLCEAAFGTQARCSKFLVLLGVFGGQI